MLLPAAVDLSLLWVSPQHICASSEMTLTKTQLVGTRSQQLVISKTPLVIVPSLSTRFYNQGLRFWEEQYSYEGNHVTGPEILSHIVLRQCSPDQRQQWMGLSIPPTFGTATKGSSTDYADPAVFPAQPAQSLDLPLDSFPFRPELSTAGLPALTHQLSGPTQWDEHAVQPWWEDFSSRCQIWRRNSVYSWPGLESNSSDNCNTMNQLVFEMLAILRHIGDRQRGDVSITDSWYMWIFCYKRINGRTNAPAAPRECGNFNFKGHNP
ncbi:hypothetical protein B0H19DRAFT_1067539 [Mycena capillaripes]|nr:hypothetical protein B0H19DRAFT_1067539 [Mycena capillaripes]